MSNKIKVLALFGKSGAGKDTIQNWILSKYPNTHKIVSHTTRPPRDYEVDGEDYNFIDIVDFTQMVLNGEMLEATEFNSWFYGTSIKELREDKLNVGVFNPTGVESLMADPRIELYSLYVNCDDKTRLIRCLSREESPNCAEICRRYFADEKDFSDLSDLGDYFEINNATEGINDNILSNMINYILHGSQGETL